MSEKSEGTALPSERVGQLEVRMAKVEARSDLRGEQLMTDS
jgi:hypothetical protein